jgi:hypothetical protein
MIIKTLSELQEPDETSLYVTPLGIEGRVRPDDAAAYLQHVISRLELSEQVPETARKSFERLRTLYAYGVLCYDLYTVAGDLARLVTEPRAAPLRRATCRTARRRRARRRITQLVGAT